MVKGGRVLGVAAFGVVIGLSRPASAQSMGVYAPTVQGSAPYAPPGVQQPGYSAPPEQPNVGPIPQQTGNADEIEYDGGKVPVDYRVVKRHQRELVVAGPIVFGVPYALGLSVSLATGLQNHTALLVAPLLGPWLTLAARHSSQVCENISGYGNPCHTDGNTDLLTSLFLVLDGITQDAGAVLFLSGAVYSKEVLVRDTEVRLHLSPAPLGRSGYGAVLSGAF